MVDDQVQKVAAMVNFLCHGGEIELPLGEVQLHVSDRGCGIQEGFAKCLKVLGGLLCWLGDLMCHVILEVLDLGEHGCRLLFQGFADDLGLLVLCIATVRWGHHGLFYSRQV